MKKKIAIIGSSGSIGKSLLNIIRSNKNNFDIHLLTANKNHSILLKQAKEFNVKNLIINNKDSYKILKRKTANTNIKVYQNFDNLNKIFKNKIDYVMSAIIGIEGLKPTLEIIKFTKKIVIANKESIICGWNLIKRELNRNNTNFVPVDSEHFSIWHSLQNSKNIEKIFITASGGPLYKIPLNKFKNVSINQALKHPNWKMGKKISIDSATMINKVYEVIEARNIFNINYSKINILIHPRSYIHALIKYNSGLINIVAHDTTMKIPIFNSIFSNGNEKLKTNKIDIKTLNNLKFDKVNINRYPMIKLLKLLPKKISLYETIIVSANDTLVELFLNKKIKFEDISKILFKFIKKKNFLKYKKIAPKKLNDIIKLSNYVRFQIKTKSI
tara:strand:+ start:1471 stop:2628 length:1158 start_codon:yes stop_codon:yes gene_type:complete